MGLTPEAVKPSLGLVSESPGRRGFLELLYRATAQEHPRLFVPERYTQLDGAIDRRHQWRMRIEIPIKGFVFVHTMHRVTLDAAISASDEPYQDAWAFLSNGRNSHPDHFLIYSPRKDFAQKSDPVVVMFPTKPLKGTEVFVVNLSNERVRLYQENPDLPERTVARLTVLPAQSPPPMLTLIDQQMLLMIGPTGKTVNIHNINRRIAPPDQTTIQAEQISRILINDHNRRLEKP
ncbi:hypothetical protein M1523_03860 [Patescibacteria group bacterium]|nr:hypothetical protein [Patescibacteria group bacterium]MCL5091829.1 hypothetical protein [Patescibacteria group bacterium]